MLRDGQRVAYAGPTDGDRYPGDEGLVIEASASYAHVKWADGSMTLSATEDLSPVASGMSVESTLDESLEMGLEVLASEEVSTEDILAKMASGGHLAPFARYAEEALDMVASRVRHDPSFLSVMASLSEDEGEDLVRLASVTLIRDAFVED